VFTIRQLVEQIIEKTGSRSKLESLPLPQDDPRQRKPNIDLTQQLLNWQPSTPLSLGLGRTIQYFDKLLSGNSV
jgi:UDP-glucuronate decarboxylase